MTPLPRLLVLAHMWEDWLPRLKGSYTAEAEDGGWCLLTGEVNLTPAHAGLPGVVERHQKQRSGTGAGRHGWGKEDCAGNHIFKT